MLCMPPAEVAVTAVPAMVQVPDTAMRLRVVVTVQMQVEVAVHLPRLARRRLQRPLTSAQVIPPKQEVGTCWVALRVSVTAVVV